MQKKKNVILENIKLLSAGAKKVSVNKTEDGKTILVSGAVPGDVSKCPYEKIEKRTILKLKTVEILERIS